MALTTEIEKLQKRWDENPLGLTFAPLAEAYRKAADPVRALELLELGLAQHPNYVPAHIVRGRCFLDAQSDAEAQTAFLRVTELDPENVIALKALAELSERAGRLPEAVQRLEVLLDVDRNNEEARGQLDRVRDLLKAANAAAMPAEALDVAVPTPEPAPSAPPIEASPPEPAPPVQPAFEVSTPNFYSPRAETEAPPAVEEPSPFMSMMAEEAPTADFGAFSEESMGDIELDNATELNSKPSGEFQIPNDAETLQTTGDRIDDLLLGSDEVDYPFERTAGHREPGPATRAGAAPEPEPPAAEVPRPPMEMDGLDSLLGEDYAALLAYRPDPEEAQTATSEPPPAPEPVANQVEGFVPIGEAVTPPRVAVLPPPEAPFEHTGYDATTTGEPGPETEPTAPYEPAIEAILTTEQELEAQAPAEPLEGIEHEQDFESLAADSASEAEAEPEPSPADGEAELVVTETMAEIFLRQGHRELAHAVYAQLALRDPGNERIASAVARLTLEEVAPAPASEPAPRFAAADTGGRSVAGLFGELLGAGRPTPSPAIHPPAFEQPKRGNGEPTRPSQESLSLSAVFGEEAAPAGPAGTPAPATGEPSFDEFFAPATGASSDSELPRLPESDDNGAQVPEDLEQFNAWLRGLKR